MYKLEELNDSKVSDLRDIAKKLEIKNYEKLKKLDLAYAILDYQAEQNNSKKSDEKAVNVSKSEVKISDEKIKTHKQNNKDFKKENRKRIHLYGIHELLDL